ncbi:hypothetical protein UA08_07174 [Talaromyces atroroseus]|uniref:Thioredoxin domain-containing protein n=1 Tax=Talaromyces atroroseus TaxID=1441469 RepID=A0A225AHH4_TALAT|nr:hypothetical protein UA08_07174 [Talaromyces atroroseus]OKL57634.1 hypothetical protein UA08_07174 [Talaromyces atroroseus]
MPPNAYDVFQELDREEQFSAQEGKTQRSYATWRERAMSRNLRRGFLIIGTCWVLYFVYLHSLYAMSWKPKYFDTTEQATDAVATTLEQNNAGKTVPLDVHVMSKCPDARDCLQQLIIPAMEKISDKVDFRLSFIGSHQDDDFDDPEDPSGIALLRESVRHSQEVGVTKSCTVRLDETVWCIRDDGKWKDCAHGSDISTFVGEVERLWTERN